MVINLKDIFLKSFNDNFELLFARPISSFHSVPILMDTQIISGIFRVQQYAVIDFRSATVQFWSCKSTYKLKYSTNNDQLSMPQL
jgi:hypothetical protein